jgi:hypothetical protein
MRTLRVTSGPAAGRSVEVDRELITGRESTTPGPPPGVGPPGPPPGARPPGAPPGAGPGAGDRAHAAGAVQFQIEGPGVKTTIPFHQSVLADEQFRSGDVSTDYLESFFARQRDGVAA